MPPALLDIAYPVWKVAIFVNGCFWHRCPKCKPGMPEKNMEYWEAKFEANLERDKRTRANLNEEGWAEIIVWECDIKKNVNDVVDGIRDKLVIR